MENISTIHLYEFILLSQHFNFSIFFSLTTISIILSW